MRKHKYKRKNLAGRIFALVGAVVLGVAGLAPMMGVSATGPGGGDYMLKVGMDDPNGATVNSMLIDGADWINDDDEFQSSTGVYTIEIDYQLGEGDIGLESGLMTSEDMAPYLENTAGMGDGAGRVHLEYSFNYAQVLIDGFDINRLSLQIFVNRNGGPGPGPGDEGNTTATVRMRGGEGGFDDSIYNEDGSLAEERYVAYADTYTEGSFAINSDWFRQMEPEDAVEGTNYSERTYKYDDDESGTVMFMFSARWHMRYVDAININGHDYPIPVDYDDQISYLQHYGGQMVSFGIEVPKAENNFYDITVKIGRSEHVWIGNFLWTADPEQQYERDCHFDDEAGEDVCEVIYDADGNPVPGRDYIGHSSLTLIEVFYTVGDMNYYCSTREDSTFCAKWQEGDEENAEICDPYQEECETPYLEFDSGDSGYDDGSLVVPAGARITMRIIPDYGYQIMNVNMADLEVSDDGIGEFTFTVPEGAAYFVADVVPVDDVVNTETDLVVDGTIDLGEGQTTLNHGSARLNVRDVDLTDEDIAGFEGVAEGYEIKNYLDISLFNVTCKGAEVCTGTDDDSWNEQIRDLNEPATITLQLEDGVDGNEIVIVHQKHDGTYEVIPTEYDPETNTLTFTTASFSNYAIASRTVVEEDETASGTAAGSPDTGWFTSENSGMAASIAGGIAIVVMISTGAAVKLYRRK